MSCNDCQTGCNSCADPIYGVCGLVSVTCIEVTEVTQVWECCKIYELNSTLEFTSSDASVDVTRDWCTIDIKAIPNLDIDRLVAVNGLDTPWFLIDKIKDCGNWVITVLPRETSPGNWILEVCGTPTGTVVPAIDERVRFKSGCSPDFLEPQLQSGQCIFIDKTGCEAIFSIKDCCFEKPEGRIVVNVWYEINIEHAAAPALQSYALPEANTTWYTNGWPGISIVTYTLPGGDVTWLQVDRWWVYRLTYHSHQGVSNWVSSWFGYIYASTLPIPVLEIWYTAPQTLSLTPYNPVDALATMDMADMEFRPFSGTSDVILPASSVLYIWGLVQTNVTSWNGAWNRWCIFVSPKSTFSVEWISDNTTGLFRHTTC